MKSTDSRLDVLQAKIKKSIYESGTGVCFLALEYQEIRAVKTLIEEKKREEESTEYQNGYEYGYKTAIKDVVKKIKEMEWHGKDKYEHSGHGDDAASSV